MRNRLGRDRFKAFVLIAAGAAGLLCAGLPTGAGAQSQDGAGASGEVYYPPRKARANDAFTPPDDGSQSKLGTLRSDGRADGGYGAGSAYNGGAPAPRGPDGDSGRAGTSHPPARDQANADQHGYGEPYRAPRQSDERSYERGYDRDRADDGPRRPGYGEAEGRTYSRNEIVDAGHHFFGGISQGLADVVEYAFQTQGRPNGYILGEDAGGAFVAGLRYGEGTLYTRDAGTHRVFWQGPSVGYDFGGEGSKTMVLVYNLRHPDDIFHRFGGVEGSAYLVGGVSVVFQKHGDVVLAPIRAGIGLRLGANVGYLKYTRSPTWNPF